MDDEEMLHFIDRIQNSDYCNKDIDKDCDCCWDCM